jgi:hypothetical protein
MNTQQDIILQEKDYAAHIEALTFVNPEEAENFCTLLLDGNGDKLSLNRAVSGAYARCLCRFLLHKKNKSRLIEIIRNNRIIREAVFGRMNTYKYSLVFMMKRVFRQNDVLFTNEILELLANNPFRDEQAKPYADRWSLGFLINETLKAPEDYMNLSDESLKIIQSYLTESE